LSINLSNYIPKSFEIKRISEEFRSCPFSCNAAAADQHESIIGASAQIRCIRPFRVPFQPLDCTTHIIYTESMIALLSDTHPKMEALQIEIIRSMPACKKLALVDGLIETVKTLARGNIRERHPVATPQEIHRMLAERLLGAELAQKVYDRAR